MDTVKSRIEYVQGEIEKAKERAGRTDNVTLIAVTKTYGVDVMAEAYEEGIMICFNR